MAATRITRVAVETALAAAKTRITDLSATAGPAAPPPAAMTRITGLAVTASGSSLSALTRITEVSVTAGAATPFGLTRITDLSVTAGPIFQQTASLPCVFYTDGTVYLPYRLLTVDDLPWS